MDTINIDELLYKYGREYEKSNIARRQEGCSRWLTLKNEYVAKKLVDNHNIKMNVSFPSFSLHIKEGHYDIFRQT